jgi:hypothetical protein
LIASKLLTGHTPTIEKAVTFHPVGMQQNIPDEKIVIFKGVTVNPRRENFIEQLIEKRLEMKQSFSMDDSEIDKTIQNTIKIIANTASYGIHIQVNTEKSGNQNESKHNIEKGNSCKTFQSHIGSVLACSSQVGFGSS